MANVWTRGLAEAFEVTFGELEETLSICPSELWETSMWDVTQDRGWGRPQPPKLADGQPDPRGINTYASFWHVAYHLLFVLDKNSSEQPAAWVPPAPFAAGDLAAGSLPARTYTRDELLSYTRYVRERVRRTLHAMQDEDAGRLTEAKVGGRDTTLARRLLNNLAHATDHHATLAMFVWQHRT